MKKLVSIVFLFALFFLFSLPTSAEDLTKIDRTIAKEPKYITQPYYALLVIGPQGAKRVWLVVDGNILYVDRNANGDLTEVNNRVLLDLEATKKMNKLHAASGPIKGTNVFDIGEVAGMRLRLEFWVRDEAYIPKNEPEFLKKYFENRQKYGWENATLYRKIKDDMSAPTPVIFCRNPKDAQVCHFDGPLTFVTKWGNRQVLKRDPAGCSFDVNIGTQSLPPRNYSNTLFSPLLTEEVPADVHPVAHFEFPNKAPGQPSIPLDVTLAQRCCGDTFYGLVRIPAEAGKGKAKVTLSFPSWIEGKVIPATFEVPIVSSTE